MLESFKEWENFELKHDILVYSNSYGGLNIVQNHITAWLYKKAQ